MLMLTEIVKHVANSHSESHLWWEWQVPVDLFVAGLVAGLMILTAFRVITGKGDESSVPFRLVSWLVPVLISIGLLALWLDLANRFNALRFYLAFVPTAPMSWGSWIILSVYPVSILFALSVLPSSMRDKIGGNKIGRLALSISEWTQKEKIRQRIAWVTFAVGIALGLYTGVLLGNLVARPLWNSAIMGPLFLSSGLATASAFLLMFGLNDKERHLMSRAGIGFISLQIVLLGLFLVSLLNGTAVQQSAVEILLGGEYTAAFWSLVFIAGLVVPLVTMIWGEFRSGYLSRWMAPAFILIGGFALRWILVYAGQVTSW